MILAITPLIIGIPQSKDINMIKSVHKFTDFDKYFFPESYSSEKHRFNVDIGDVSSEMSTFSKEAVESHSIGKKITPLRNPCSGPMDSPWSMYCHDVRHTGRSPYSTVNTWDEIWNFKISGWPCSPTIDKNGTIYIGAYNLYAVYPNGTLKWRYLEGFSIESAPAIDENGVIYFGTEYAYPNDYLYAIYTINGTLKWKYPASNVYTSPAIANDGTIIFTDSDNWNIKALNPNGTQKWGYHTNMVIYSSPAIGLDGTIYCGSHDGNVYALYPNNGTLKWKYDTGSWVHGSPTIADDGTVYIGSDNGYLYAFYPNNGTVKWMANIGEVYGSPALDSDGTIYVGVWEKTFYAIYPNGTIKWSFNPGAKIWGSSPALSSDGTLYFGTCDLEYTGGVEIIALYTDGTVKWRKSLDTVFSSPAIGSDGTVYIGSNSEPGKGYLNAFGIGPLEADANGPYYGIINEPVQFTGSSSGGYSPHSYHWDFGDNHYSDEQNPTHIYTNAGNYTVTLTVTDNTGNTSSDTTYAWIQTSNTPPNKPSITGETNGNVGTSYDYTFTTADPEGAIIWYYVEWGDNSNTGWVGPYASGTEVIKSHYWSEKGTYIIRCKAKDPYNAESEWGTLSVTMPLDLQSSQSNSQQISLHSSNQLLLKMIQRLLLNIK